MQYQYPLKTLIISNSAEQILALRQFIGKFPSIFSIQKITSTYFDLLQILSAESFDLTFFDETFVPLEYIEQFGKARFGIVIFRSQKTLSWKYNLFVGGDGYYSLEPPYYRSGPELIKNITEGKDQPGTAAFYIKCSKRRLSFKVEGKTFSLPENDIICIICQGNESTVYYQDTNGIKSFKKWVQLSELKNQLDMEEIFFRTDRNYLINLAYVAAIDTKSARVILRHPYQRGIPRITISTRKLRLLAKRYPSGDAHGLNSFTY